MFYTRVYLKIEGEKRQVKFVGKQPSVYQENSPYPRFWVRAW